MARPHLKIAAALKDHLSVAVNKDLIPFVGFGVSAANQRAVVSLLAQVHVNCWIVRRAIPIQSVSLGPAVFLSNCANS